MEQKKDMDLQLTARWINEDGNECEKILQINNIMQHNSLVIELKALEKSLNIPMKLSGEEIWCQDYLGWIQENISKNTGLWVQKKTPDLYQSIMQNYWNYYEYELSEEKAEKIEVEGSE